MGATSPRRHSQGVLAQARILIPGFARVSKDPLDPAGSIVKSNNKVFPTRDDKRIVAGPVSHRIIMKPVVPAADERARIISSGSHGGGDNLGHIPTVTYAAPPVDLQDNAFEIGICVYFQKQPMFTAVNIVMEPCHPDTAVVADNADRPIYSMRMSCDPVLR